MTRCESRFLVNVTLEDPEQNERLRCALVTPHGRQRHRNAAGDLMWSQGAEVVVDLDRARDQAQADDEGPPPPDEEEPHPFAPGPRSGICLTCGGHRIEPGTNHTTPV